MLWRGARRRCPWCGGRGAFFTGWFAKQDRCRTCGLGWQRGYEGFELGAMTINIIVVFGTLIVGLIVAVALTVPDIPVVPLIVALVCRRDRPADRHLPGELHAVAGGRRGDAPSRSVSDPATPPPRR